MTTMNTNRHRDKRIVLMESVQVLIKNLNELIAELEHRKERVINNGDSENI